MQHQQQQQQHPITSPAVGHIYDCGNTTAEARERNCTFELFTVSWVPPACADEDLDAEFRAIGYRYFADKENTQELTYEELANRVWQTAWTTNEQHLMHCGYVWRKMHRAVEAGKRHSDRELEWEHTVHCSGLIVKPGDLGEIISIEPDFGRCY
ncbi:hypothetical protein ETB97_009293 [Aspergillus alliaceus]|uniref:Uncharacterized protein n=1 Tax=Petromyces alliaceus TaxID=209559 RepID=A0A8H6AB67_PETAA|nr:hypothetical protein ETB97_009293 [Aspergillus burnettii]